MEKGRGWFLIRAQAARKVISEPGAVSYRMVSLLAIKYVSVGPPWTWFFFGFPFQARGLSVSQ